jgi:hypothetical protein
MLRSDVVGCYHFRGHCYLHLQHEIKAAWSSETLVSCHITTGHHNAEHHDQKLLGIQSNDQRPIQWVTGALSLGIKRPGREADHSPPSSAKVKNAWSYTSAPRYALMAWCSVKARGQLYLYLMERNNLDGISGRITLRWTKRHRMGGYKLDSVGLW